MRAEITEITTARDGGTEPGEVEYMELDLASSASIKNFVDMFKDRELPLHILVNNAAVAYVKFGEN